MILFKSFIENQQHPMPGSQKYQTHIVKKNINILRVCLHTHGNRQYLL